MTILVINLLAVLGYLTASIYQLMLIKLERDPRGSHLFTLTSIAITLHIAGCYLLMVTSNGLDLGIAKMSSVLLFVINLLVLLSSIRKPLHNLFIFLFPLACLSIALSLFWQKQHIVTLSSWVSAHILLSIMAYSLLSIASLQAALLAWQNHQLKHHQLTGPIKLLPPLQTMEQLMFELVSAGVALLTLGIIAGFIFLEDIFSQHLVHKTVLSLSAWLVFTGLLWGRYSLGWRGTLAVKWVFCGIGLLLLAYFGSKLVLEVIL